MLEDSVLRYNSLLRTIGKAGLNSLFPNDFEAYVIAFELVDSTNASLEFLSFPVLPSNITVSEPEIVNIKKTARGVVSLRTDSFVPREISLSGNFGRNFKILYRNKLIDFSVFKRKLSLNKQNFSGINIKTGYGTIKAFQELLNNSKMLDSRGLPMRLYFYNFTFGDNYIVEVTDKSFTQSRDSSNMIWNYSVNLKAVAPLEFSGIRKTSLFNISSASAMQSGINTLSGSITSYLTTNKQSYSNKIASKIGL